MSIFVRPDSPPPRQPSPDILPTPLPYPHHPRRVPSQPKIRVHSPTVPPGLHTRTQTLHSPRSCDFFTNKAENSDDGHSSLDTTRKRTRSTVTSTLAGSSLTSTPSTSRSPSLRNSPDFAPHHRRTLSVAFPSQSPPSSPSPAPSDSAPPVPSVPYRYTGPKHIVSPKPVACTPIVLPEVDEHRSDVYYPPPTLERKPTPVLPALEKHKSMGIACLKFFGIRTPSRQPRVAAAM
ncbi:hypothetical protein BDZ97DRAFT_1911615 [Flammula alnicola]|nr:hypothetical protein BDZ97DRAFT_1911615 [Flammula alnicola]